MNNKKTKWLVLRILIISLCISSYTVDIFASNVDESDDPIIVVSLGDSYSSGEGIEKFYGQDEPTDKKVQNPDWLAHRSQNSWAGQLSVDGGVTTLSQHKDEGTWFFEAVSGAVTANLKDKAQIIKYSKGNYKGGVYSFSTVGCF